MTPDDAHDRLAAVATVWIGCRTAWMVRRWARMWAMRTRRHSVMRMAIHLTRPPDRTTVATVANEITLGIDRSATMAIAANIYPAFVGRATAVRTGICRRRGTQPDEGNCGDSGEGGFDDVRFHILKRVFRDHYSLTKTIRTYSIVPHQKIIGDFRKALAFFAKRFERGHCSGGELRRLTARCGQSNHRRIRRFLHGGVLASSLA